MFGNLFQGGLGFLSRSLRGSEWRQLLDYVAPSFLDVMPISHLVGQARELLALSTDTGRFARARDDLAVRLSEAGVDVDLAGAEPPALGALGELDAATRRKLGDAALEIYFLQLATPGATVLDLRSSRFAAGAPDGPVTWAPRPLYVQWDPDFQRALRDLYGGYYRDETDRFDAALKELHLEPARDVFLSHFGSGDQRAVRFRSEVFHATFHDAFVACRDEGATLHRNFLALGVYLACLYDLLEVLDLEFDVRAAFERVWR